MTLYYTRGLPGSGKSTLARKMVTSSKNNLTRVNRDDLRALQPGWQRHKFDKNIEATVVKERDRLMNEALAAGHDAINDDTNLGASHAKHWAAMAKKHGATLECIDFLDPQSPNYVPVEKCIKQDLMRNEVVGKDVILRMWNDAVLKEIIEPEWHDVLPNAFIFDIDGTLAHHEGVRGPYEEKYDLDNVDRTVAALLRLVYSAGNTVIILSGREGSAVAEKQTLDWLKDKDLPYHEFYMRPCGDRRSDVDVKKEIFEKKVQFRYNIIGVFDDRPKVIRMWETLGLKVLKCGPGMEF